MQISKKKIEELISLYRSRDFNNAEILCKKLIKSDSRVVILYNIMGLILSELNRIDEAVHYYERGTRVNPDFAMIYNNLGTLYRKKNDNTKAEDNFKKAILLDKKLPEPHNNLGNLYFSLNMFDKAISSFQESINLNKKFYWAHYNLGILYITTGDFYKALISLEECIKHNIIFCPAHRSISRIKKYKESTDTNLLQMIKIFTEKKIDDNQKIELSFAIGKAYEDIEDYNNSIRYYNTGNDLHRKRISFSLSKEKLEFLEIKKIFNKNLFSRFNNSNNNGNNIIFILGMPRSGTTLIEQIISGHSEVYGGDELNYIPNILKKFFFKNENLYLEKINYFKKDDLVNLGNEYLEKVSIIKKQYKIITDKLPINFKWIGFIKLILPKSKIIHCTRNAKDNCLSIYKNLFAKSDINFAYNFNELIEYYHLYKDLMDHWHNDIPNFVTDINYENIINDPKKEVQKILKACNLKWEENCLEFHKNKRAIKTASDVQARKKLYSSSIDSWENYESHLKNFFEKLN